MTKRTITLRLVIDDPLPGVTYSLQDRKSSPVSAVVAGDAALSFDVPIQVSPGPKLSGEFVRREGPERRFVYIAIGGQAGDPASEWSRRAKIDVHDLPRDLLEQAAAPLVLECHLPGRAKDGGPACATIRPISGWHLVDRQPGEALMSGSGLPRRSFEALHPDRCLRWEGSSRSRRGRASPGWDHERQRQAERPGLVERGRCAASGLEAPIRRER